MAYLTLPGGRGTSIILFALLLTTPSLLMLMVRSPHLPSSLHAQRWTKRGNLKEAFRKNTAVSGSHGKTQTASAAVLTRSLANRWEKREISKDDQSKLYLRRHDTAKGDDAFSDHLVSATTQATTHGAQRTKTGPKNCKGDDITPTPEEAETIGALRAVWAAMHRARMRVRVTPPLLNDTVRDTVPLLLNRKQFKFETESGMPSASNTLLVRPTTLVGGPKAWPEFRITFEEGAISVLPEDDLGAIREPTSAAFRYGTCAVVGNSGRLLHSSLGEQIDSHDAVFRINYAPTAGYEEHVGKRTSFDVCNHQHARAFLYSDDQRRNSTTADLDALPWDGEDTEEHVEKATTTTNETASQLRQRHRDAFPSKRSSYRPSTVLLFEVLEFYGKNVYGRLKRKLAHLSRLAGNPTQTARKERLLIFSPQLAMHAKSLWTMVRSQLLRWQAPSAVAPLARRRATTRRRRRRVLLGSTSNLLNKMLADAKSKDNTFHSKVKATSGWYAMFFAAQVCETVRLYGMSGYSGKEKHWDDKAHYHYFDNAKAVFTAHSFDISFGALRALSEYPCADGYRMEIVE